MSDKITRRGTLRIGAATAGLGVTGSLSGCSSIPFLGGGSSAYDSWLPEPGVIVEGTDHYSFSYSDVKAIRNNEDNFDEDVFEAFESSEDSFPLDQMNVDFDEVTSKISVNGSNGVITGTFKRDDVGSELEDDDFEEDGDHEGYTLYTKQGSQGVAVKKNEAVYAQLGFFSGGDEPKDVLEALIDTKKGNEERYAKAEEDFKTLIGKLGSGTLVDGGTQEEPDETNAEAGRFEGAVARGSKLTVNGETSKAKRIVVFNSKDDIDMHDVEDWTDSDSFDDYDNVNSSKNGRAVVVTAKIDTDDYGWN